MNIIFLDIDGVLCTHRARASHGLNSTQNKCLDPVACRFVAQLIKEFDAQVVISSTWRMQGRDQFVDVLLRAGQSELINALHQNWATDKGGRCRGEEIQVWLDSARLKSVSHYVILDDDSDMLSKQMPNLVKTNGYNGLSFGDYLKARQILGAEDFPPKHAHLFKWGMQGCRNWEERE